MSDTNNQEKIRLYLGTACGKTTATFGVAVRALSSGKNVSIVFFDKLEENSSEGKLFKFLSQNLDNSFGKLNYYYTGINRLGCGPKGSFRFYSSPNGILEDDKNEALRGINILQNALKSNQDIVIADELLDVARVGIINFDTIKEITNMVSDKTLLVMTGRKEPDWLMEKATTIATTVQLKHHGKAITGVDC